MGTFTSLHTQLLYYRPPAGNSTASNAAGSPAWGSPVAFYGISRLRQVRVSVDGGYMLQTVLEVETHTEIPDGSKIFPLGNAGTDVLTGRIASVHVEELGLIGAPGEKLYRASAA